MQDVEVQNYIAAEFARERLLIAEQLASPVGFLRQRLKEFYWTATRLLGLSYLHDGSKATRRAIVNARRDRYFFPVAAPARHLVPGERLLIDVTDTVACGFTTGIQRVVRQLCQAAMEAGYGIPVFIENGRLLTYLDDCATRDEIEIVRGDKFVMADVSWNDIPARQEVMAAVTERGGKNIVILHDIIPLMHPELYPRDFYSDTVDKFAHWFDAIIVKCDAVIAVSKHVADDFRAYVAAHEKAINPNLWIDWNHLGADFDIGANETVSTQVSDICRESTPFFLSVETLEPRKGGRIALDAVDSLWAQGVDVRYVIAGRCGNCARALRQRIVTHPEYGRRLFWLDRASDADLRHLYSHGRSLVFASVDEGFGLPLVEAAHFGLPVIASDIAVFREIGGDAVTYFDVAKSEVLASRMRQALTTPKTVNSLPVLSWRASTENLLRKLRRQADQFGPVKLCA